MKGGSYEAISRSSSSCAACKLLKRRCSATCIFAPYFRSDEPKKFAKVHKVFGASNVSKILIEVPEDQREDTVNSLAYEAEARLLDPVYGCIGAIALLQRRMAELQRDLAIARARLARLSAINHNSHNNSNNNNEIIIHNNSSSSTSCCSNCSYGVFDGLSDHSGFGHVHGQTPLEFGHLGGATTSASTTPCGGATIYDYGFVPFLF